MVLRPYTEVEYYRNSDVVWHAGLSRTCNRSKNRTASLRCHIGGQGFDPCIRGLTEKGTHYVKSKLFLCTLATLYWQNI